MAETSQPLTTEPAEAVMHKPSGEGQTTTTLTLTNPEASRVAYKVKTTDNAKFRIKPVMGVLEPEASVTVNLTCQKLDDPANPPSKQRYVVFSILTDKTSGREAWEAAVTESGNKNIGKRKNLPIIWEEPPAPEPEAPGAEEETAEGAAGAESAEGEGAEEGGGEEGGEEAA